MFLLMFYKLKFLKFFSTSKTYHFKKLIKNISGNKMLWVLTFDINNHLNCKTWNSNDLLNKLSKFFFLLSYRTEKLYINYYKKNTKINKLKNYINFKKLNFKSNMWGYGYAGLGGYGLGGWGAWC